MSAFYASDGSGAASHGVQANMGFHGNFWQATGHAELKKCMKSSEEFCKDVSSLMAERADVEANYQKNLMKLAVKASKISAKATGSLQLAWVDLVTSMTSEAEFHKTLSDTLATQISKPLKTHADEMYKKRKEGEATVEKAHKALSDQRSREHSSRVAALSRAKEAENLTITLEDPAKSDKETIKLGKILRKAEDLSARTEKEYRRDCIEAENLRIEWEQKMYTFCLQMESVDQRKTEFCRDMFRSYETVMSKPIPLLRDLLEKLGSSIDSVDPARDLADLCESKGTGPNSAEHLLYTCFAEDLSATMNSTRRTQALEEKCGFFLKESRKSEQFRKGLISASGLSSDEVNNLQLARINALVDFLQANMFRLLQALNDHKGQSPPEHRLSEFIDIKDVKGQQSYPIMTIPLTEGIFRDATPDAADLPFIVSMQEDDTTSTGSSKSKGGRRIFSMKKSSSTASNQKSSLCVDGARMATSRTSIGSNSFSIDSRVDEAEEQGIAGGAPALGRSRTAAFDRTRTQSFHPADDEDEFDNFDDDLSVYDALGSCKAAYDYDGADETELTIREGDIIEITLKEGVGDGWWQGILNGKEGVFPLSYVEQF